MRRFLGTARVSIAALLANHRPATLLCPAQARTLHDVGDAAFATTRLSAYARRRRFRAGAREFFPPRSTGARRQAVSPQGCHRRLRSENNLDLAIARYNLPIAEHGYSAHQGRRNFSRREHRRGARNARRRCRRIWRGRSRRGRGRHHGRRRRSGSGRFRIGAIHAGAVRRSLLMIRRLNASNLAHRASDAASREPADLRRALPAAEHRTSTMSPITGLSHRHHVDLEFHNNRQTTN